MLFFLSLLLCTEARVLDVTRVRDEFAGPETTFDGIGGLSGGGATTLLLPHYPEQQRSEILDLLFKPNYGASLQILKVEIGGDSQSTDGCETSHMHSPDDLSYERGYEWWLMTEAKKRNPNIKLYGLPWAFPGWLGKGSGSPYTYPNLTAGYVVKWVQGAKEVYGLDIDYIGIWNERTCDETYVKTLRAALDTAGFSAIQIVAPDGGDGICSDLAKDPSYAAAVDIVGLHYPSDFDDYSTCHSLNKPLWASEESSSYDDLNGAACWARVITSHFVLSSMTASIMWNLVGSYYHGTNWYASSMLTAVEPWSGHYEVNPVIWATAHVTQFTEIGWVYLAQGHGSGSLPNGGYYTTLVDPNSKNFTINIVKIDHEHAACTRPALPSFSVAAENVTIALDASMSVLDGETLTVWFSNLESDPLKPVLFEQQQDIVVQNGQLHVFVPVGGVFTISTVRTATKGSVPSIPDSSPEFPLPYKDDFSEVQPPQEARYWADQIGVFEVHNDTANGANVMRQMVPELPIGWSDHGSNGPVSVIGNLEWQDVSIEVSFMLPPAPFPPTSAACVGTRVDQMWQNGIVLCVNARNEYNLTSGGPAINGDASAIVYSSGVLKGVSITQGAWHELKLVTVGGFASAYVDTKNVLVKIPIRDIDTGFSAIGSNSWIPIEYGHVVLDKAGPSDLWDPTSPCAAAKVGTVLSVRNCSRNSVRVSDLEWALEADWTLRHTPSGLCATADAAKDGAGLTLQTCTAAENQQLLNDYTRIRNFNMPMTLKATSDGKALLLGGSKNGQVSVNLQDSKAVDWQAWCYFPNTGELRNEFTAYAVLGYPMCISSCPPA